MHFASHLFIVTTSRLYHHPPFITRISHRLLLVIIVITLTAFKYHEITPSVKPSVLAGISAVLPSTVLRVSFLKRQMACDSNPPEMRWVDQSSLCGERERRSKLYPSYGQYVLGSEIYRVITLTMMSALSGGTNHGSILNVHLWPQARNGRRTGDRETSDIHNGVSAGRSRQNKITLVGTDIEYNIGQQVACD